MSKKEVIMRGDYKEKDFETAKNYGIKAYKHKA